MESTTSLTPAVHVHLANNAALGPAYRNYTLRDNTWHNVCCDLNNMVKGIVEPYNLKKKYIVNPKY